MKKKLFTISTVLILAIVVAINVSVVRNQEFTDISLNEVEALAGDESSDEPNWNHWTQWFTQGFTKDEAEWKRKCSTSSDYHWSGSVSVGYGPWNVGVSGGGGGSQQNPPERESIDCVPGDSNCSSADC